jgi:hypothetical protein
MGLISFKIRSQGHSSLSVEAYTWSLTVVCCPVFPVTVWFSFRMTDRVYNPTGYVMGQNHGHTEHKARLPVEVEGSYECSMLKPVNMTVRSLTHTVFHTRTPRPRVWTPKRDKRTCLHFYCVWVALCRFSPTPVHYEYYQISTNTKMKTWAAWRCHGVLAVLMIRFLLRNVQILQQQ